MLTGIGINKICKVIESGSLIAGNDVSLCSNEFKNLYDSSDMVIAKGQGNFETMLSEKRNVNFLFKVKCKNIANISGIPMGYGALLLNHKS